MADRRYRVVLIAGARRELADAPTPDQRRIGRAIDGLVVEPRPPGARLLETGSDSRIWRIRVGVYRVLYEIRDSELLVLVIRIGHRREVYRRRRSGG
jgi:mRNA interferase RelE/StbE